MKQRLEDIFKGPVVFYPLLFAAFPILFLYVHNINEISAIEVWLPLAISVAATLVLWVVLSLILRSLSKAGFATAIFLVFFFSYGRFYDVLVNSGLFVARHAYLLPATLFIWGYCVYFISRTKRDFRITTKLFNITAVVLIAINLFNIGAYQVKLARLNDVTPEESPAEAPANSGEPSTLPDIYLIIMDEYAHPDTMLEWYEYDNTKFVDTLEDKGFFVAHGSRTPTGSTPLVIAQILNMEHLDYEPWSDPTYRKLAYNKVAEILKARGYRYMAFGTQRGRLEEYMKDSTDVYFGYYRSTATHWASEFQAMLWNTTMLRPFYYHISGLQYEMAYRRLTLHTLTYLKTIPEQEGPWFVLAHLMCPHEPFVFGPEGQYTASSDWSNYVDKQLYLGQYIFISSEIQKVLDALLERSETQPIIILQSDHGLRPHHAGIVIGGDEWRKILNAMYLPGMDYSELSDSISPLNTFRLIFNHYFGADYQLLEND